LQLCNLFYPCCAMRRLPSSRLSWKQHCCIGCLG
jgi:hypothetical protein